MRRCLTLLGLLLLLSACATEEKYQAMLQGWVGASERELVQGWGPPDSVYEHEGQRYLTWARHYQSYLPGSPPHYETRMVGDRVYTTRFDGSPGMLINSRCKTTFILEGGQVTAWRTEGNACRT